MGHCAGVGTAQGTAGPVADANSVPLPGNTQFFDALVAWVEAGTAPNSLVVSSADASVSMPICAYPQKATYSGSGSPTSAASYSCK
jgi:feruloyl esterase